MINLGILVIAVTIAGYLSNWINWQYLDFSVTLFLYRIGWIVHELSHTIVCFLTGAKITEVKLFSRNPHVTYLKPKIPFLGDFLISLAPILGGLAFLFLVNKFFLSDYFTLLPAENISEVLTAPFYLLSQINLSEWQSWLMILLFFNAGAMIGPSFQDLKNVWPAILAAFFIKWELAVNLCALAGSLIITNLIIQVILILAILFIKALRRS